MDMRALKVGQKVILSGALPGGGTTGVVMAVEKYFVVVKVAAQIKGEDGAYAINFDYNGNMALFYSWKDAFTPAWDWAGTPCPIPNLKIIETCD
jgi:hypothetical protein